MRRRDRRASRRTLVPRRSPAGGNSPPGRTLYRGCRLCRRLRRFAAARAITLHRRLRTPRCRPAAERSERSRDLTHVGTEGRNHGAGKGLLRQARARPADISCAANDSVLSRGVGIASRRRAAASQHTRARHLESAPQGMGDGHEDLRDESGVKDRARFTKALDELQAAMIVVPTAAVYAPKFTYIWSLGIDRFPGELRKRVSREVAVREIARCFLAGAGMTIPGELARVTGLAAAGSGAGEPCARGGRLRDQAGSRRVPTRREGAIRPGGGEHRARAKGSHSRRGRRTTRAARRLRLPEAATP